MSQCGVVTIANLTYSCFSQQSLEIGCRWQDCDVCLSTEFYRQQRSVVSFFVVVILLSLSEIQ